MRFSWNDLNKIITTHDLNKIITAADSLCGKTVAGKACRAQEMNEENNES